MSAWNAKNSTRYLSLSGAQTVSANTLQTQNLSTVTYVSPDGSIAYATVQFAGESFSDLPAVSPPRAPRSKA